MNLFMKKTRVELGLKKTKAICVFPSSENFSPDIQIDDLRYTLTLNTIFYSNYICIYSVCTIMYCLFVFTIEAWDFTLI